MNIKIKKNYILGFLLGMASFATSLCLFALLMLLFKIDRAYSELFATISISLGAFVTSFFVARKSGSKGYLVGLIGGCIYFSLIMVVSLIITKSHIGSNTAFHFVIIVLASTVGGVMGVNKKNGKLKY